MDWRHLLQELQQGNWQALLLPEVAMLIVGILLLMIGARIYRLIIIAPGFICGALLAKQFVSGSPEVQLIVTLVLGIVGAVLLTSIEKLAISIVGALLFAGLTFAIAPLVMGTVAWFVPVIAGFLGSMIFPYIYKKALPVSTALLGSLCVCWSTGLNEDPIMIAVFWVGGIVLQLILGGALSDKAD